MNFPFWSYPIVVFAPGFLCALVLLVLVIRAIGADRRASRTTTKDDYIPGNSQTAIELNCEASLRRSQERRQVYYVGPDWDGYDSSGGTMR